MTAQSSPYTEAWLRTFKGFEHEPEKLLSAWANDLLALSRLIVRVLCAQPPGALQPELVRNKSSNPPNY